MEGKKYYLYVGSAETLRVYLMKSERTAGLSIKIRQKIVSELTQINILKMFL